MFSASVGEEVAAVGVESLRKALPEAVVTTVAWDVALPPRPVAWVQAYIEAADAEPVAAFALKSLEPKGKLVVAIKGTQVGPSLSWKFCGEGAR